MTASNKGSSSSRSSSIDPTVFHQMIEQITEAVCEKLQDPNRLNAGLTALQPPTRSAVSAEATVPIRLPVGKLPTTAEELAGMIDHTLLKPDTTRAQIEQVCAEARTHHFATVCVNPSQVAWAAQCLEGTKTPPIAVVDFPLGAASSTSKAFEAREAIRAGAKEIDMVINIGALKSRDYALVQNDIRQVVEASYPYPVKVILETSSLTQDEKIIGCALSKSAGAAFVKTSTGFGSGGATAEDIQLMRRVVGPEMGVKASGGIRTLADALKMIEAGANRVGASASVAIVEQFKTGGSTPASSQQQNSGKTDLY